MEYRRADVKTVCDSLPADVANGKMKPGFEYLTTDTIKIHPSLRGGEPPDPHCFSRRQMEVLTSICDTIFPSLPMQEFSKSADSTAKDQTFSSECEEKLTASPSDVQDYYNLSASAWDVPVYAAGFMTRMLKRFQLNLIGLILFLLSTRLGTFMICGANSIVKTFPFIGAFPNLPLEKREKILQAWSQTRVLQAAFKALKCVVAWNCFARADARGYNPLWKAIGYYVPREESKLSGTRSRRRPLEGKVLNVKEVGLCERLRESGFVVREGLSAADGQENNKGSPITDITVKCDAVVIGSGSGGSVIAAVLAKAGYQVLVLEKGDYYARDDYSGLEGASSKAMMEGPSYVVTKDASIIVRAGATVGGGSAVNWGASLRTPDHVLREWGEEIKLFKESRYQEAMDAVCERMGVQKEVERESMMNMVFRMGCQKMGYHVESAPCNSAPDHVCGWCEFGCRSGGKQSASETWLVDAVATGKALVLADCLAEKVVLRSHLGSKGRKAVGAMAVSGNRRLFVEARCTIAAGGALQTPLLLRRSGLVNSHIGQHLHLHPSILAWGYVPDDPTVERNPFPGRRSFEGPIISAFSRQCARWDQPDAYGSLLECPAVHPGAFAVIAPWGGSGAAFKRTMRRFSRTSLVFTLTRDHGGGSVFPGPRGCPEIDYRVSTLDRVAMLDGLQHAIRVLAVAPGVVQVGTMSLDGDSTSTLGPFAQSELEAYLARVRTRGIHGLNYSIQSAHQMGSCRMGINAATSAIDPNCESWEVEGLFLGDTSVFPTALGVNPMITVQSIAYCTAHNIIQYLKNSV